MRFLFALTLALHVAAAPLSETTKIQHALDRLTFGARPGDVEQVRQLGLRKWIELQLHPDKIAESPILEQKLKPLESLLLSAEDMAKEYGKGDVVKELSAGKIYRVIYSNRQ